MLDLRKKIFLKMLKKIRDFLTILEQFKFSKKILPHFPIFLIKGWKYLQIFDNDRAIRHLYCFRFSICKVMLFQGFSCVWNKKEYQFKKDFGHSQNLS